MAEILLIEPFYGGSHKQLIDTLEANIEKCVKFTLPAKKWHWRARTSALYFSQTIPASDSYRVLFASAVLNLAELLALRADLAALKKVVYFHENQLVYPVRKQQDRDFQYGYNQILSCLVADEVVFNSCYNRDSFLASIDSFLKLIPDHRPRGLVPGISSKCRVLYFPLVLAPVSTPQTDRNSSSAGASSSLHPNNSFQGGSEHVTDVKDPCSDVHADLPSASSGLDTESCASFEKACSVDEEEEDVSKDCVEADSHVSCAAGAQVARKSTCSAPEDKRDETVTVGSGDDMGVQREEKQDVVSIPPILATRREDLPALHIVWPHRWEHDKDPEAFFAALYSLQDAGLSFLVSVLGEQFTDVPDVFGEVRERLGSRVLHWGHQASRAAYLAVLASAHLAVSTAQHEFFGVAMLEAAHAGCYPLCPKRLVYPEIFPEECLYNTQPQLVKKLRHFCQRPHLAQQMRPKLDLERFSWGRLEADYRTLLSVQQQ